MAKIELEMKAHTQGAVQNLKATQANINKVADAFVKLQNEGTNMSSMNNAVSGFYELIDRLASSMFASGDAASYFEAKMKVVESALQSASQMNNGDMSQVADVLRSMYTEAENASFALNDLTDAEMELAEDAEDTNKVLTKQGSKLLDVAKNILKFQLLMQPITALIRGFKDTLSESVKVAAEAEQTYSKLSTVFEGLASATDKADELARKIGTSSTTAAGALSTVGDLLQAQGMTVSESLATATDWVEKFQDIIAFKDLDMSLEEFSQSFMSGAAGNLRNFRTFGSIVKESAVNARLAKDGLDKLTGTQLELAKMTTRATLALEQQSNAYGATEREWESMLSIQRRMEEQSKKLKENLGEYMNEALKPIESTWGRILKSINDSIEAEKALSRMSGGDGPTNIVNKILTGMSNSDYAAKAVQYGVKMHPKTGDFTDSEVEDLIRVGREIYGKTDEVITQILTTLDEYTVGVEQLNRAFKSVNDADAAKLAKETADAEKERIKSVYDAFVESLEGIGLTVFGSAPTNMGDLRDYAGIDLSDVFGDLKVTGLDEFADQIRVALGDDTTADALKAKQSAWASLYEIARNFFITNNEDHKLTQDNLDLLGKIKDEYQGINTQLDDYQKNLDRITNVDKAIANGFDGGAKSSLSDLEDVQAFVSLRGWSEEYAKAYVTARNLYKSTLAEAELIEDEEDRTSRITAITDEWNDTIVSLSDYYAKIAEDAERTRKAEEYIAAMDGLDKSSEIQQKRYASGFERMGYTSEYSSAWASYLMEQQALAASYASALSNASTEEEKTAAQIAWEEASNYLKEQFEEDWDGVSKTVAEQTREALQKSLSESFVSAGGQLGNVIDTFTGGGFTEAMGSLGELVSGLGAAAGPIGMIIEEVIKVFASLDVVTQTMGLVSDVLSTVLNDFLEPFLPAIDAVSSILTSLFETVLLPFYPYIQQMAKALTFVLGLIDILVNYVEDSMKFLISHVVKGFQDMVNWVIDIINHIPGVNVGKMDLGGNMQDWYGTDPTGNAEAKWNDLMKTLASIDDNVFGTRKNTESDIDTSKLDALLSAGLISEAQYNQRLGAKQAGLNWDTVGASMSGYVSANNHTTQVQAGAVSIVINGANDSTEVQRQVYRALQDAGIAVAGQAI